MKLYHISQDEASGYDTWSDAVVCAESEDDAKTIHPWQYDDAWARNGGFWCKSPESVTAKYLGEAAPDLKRGIICSSFHAG